MKLSIIGIIILFTHISQAAPTIKPIEDDHSFYIMKDNQEKAIINQKIKNYNVFIRNKSCNYSINDFRHERKIEVGCAVKTNRKKANINGDICN